MKTFFKIFILALLFNCASAKAQQYKTHKVQDDETIISIAKLYKVTPLEIYQLNPDARDGLRPNAILIIPKTKVPSANSNTVVTRDEKKPYTASQKNIISLLKTLRSITNGCMLKIFGKVINYKFQFSVR